MIKKEKISNSLAVGIWLAILRGYLTGAGLTINNTIGKFSGDGLGND